MKVSVKLLAEFIYFALNCRRPSIAEIWKQAKLILELNELQDDLSETFVIMSQNRIIYGVTKILI